MKATSRKYRVYYSGNILPLRGYVTDEWNWVISPNGVVGIIDFYGSDESDEIVPIDNTEVEFCSNVLDKHGIPLYEGDIIYYRVHQKEVVAVVEFNGICFAAHEIDSLNVPSLDIVLNEAIDGVEVTGNIHWDINKGENN